MSTDADVEANFIVLSLRDSHLLCADDSQDRSSIAPEALIQLGSGLVYSSLGLKLPKNRAGQRRPQPARDKQWSNLLFRQSRACSGSDTYSRRLVFLCDVHLASTIRLRSSNPATCRKLQDLSGTVKKNLGTTRLRQRVAKSTVGAQGFLVCCRRDFLVAEEAGPCRACGEPQDCAECGRFPLRA